jgi:hypothetical protein
MGGLKAMLKQFPISNPYPITVRTGIFRKREGDIRVRRMQGDNSVPE